MKQTHRQALRLILLILAGAAFLWFAPGFLSKACAQTGTIWDVPPARYQRLVGATVHYSERETIMRVCGNVRATGCQIGSNIYVPVQFSPTRREMSRFELIDVAAEYRGGSIRGAYMGHEGAHVAGWPADHPR